MPPSSNDLVNLSSPSTTVTAGGYGRQPLLAFARAGVIPSTVTRGEVWVTRAALDQFAQRCGGQGYAETPAHRMGARAGRD